MKRKSNGLVIGTVLVLLVGALIFIQARNEEPSDEDALPVMTSPPPAGANTAPSVDDALDRTGPSRSPSPAPQ